MTEMHHRIQVYKKFSKKSYAHFILGADVGGTNTNLGIFGIKNNKPELLALFHFKSKELKAMYHSVNEALQYAKEEYTIAITQACIAGAGPVSPKGSSIGITKLSWGIKRSILLQKTKLKDVKLINDFEAAGYGINMLSKNDIVAVKNAEKIPKAPIVVIGAGTGLGKSTLIYSNNDKAYIPLPSEAGHCDFPAQSREEIELAEFIRKSRKIRENVSYEQILSGPGIENIYSFLRKKTARETSYTKGIGKSKNKPELISRYRKADETCRKTFEIFRDEYARFAANCALDALPYGGIYIAGGIAPKNPGIFDLEFVRKFEEHHERSDILKKIPIYLVINYNAGLLGAGFAGTKTFI